MKLTLTSFLLLLFLGMIQDVHGQIDCYWEHKKLSECKSDCEKLKYIEEAWFKEWGNHCFINFFFHLAELTGHEPNVNYGFEGIFYEDDSLCMDDMLVWKNILGCMAEIDLEFRVLTYKEESADSLIQIQFGPFGHYSKRNKNNYLFTNPQRTDGSFIDPKSDSTENYALSVFTLKKICLMDDTIRRIWHPRNLLHPVLPGGIDLRSTKGDTCSLFGLGRFVLEEKGNWVNDSSYFIFQSIGGSYPSRRFMYVHNVGFLWEELQYESKSYRWVLEAIDGEPVLDFLRNNPDYAFLK